MASNISQLETNAGASATRWTCNTCHTSFADSMTQRQHMKGQWHIYNLKRRVAELPPLEWTVFESQFLPNSAESDIITNEVKRRENQALDHDGDEESDNDFEVMTCLFCDFSASLVSDPNAESDSMDQNEDDSAHLENAFNHMLDIHGLFVPDRELLLDQHSFLGYLAIVVRDYHECLYCGTSRSTGEAIQQHMRTKGHCMLNFGRESELLEFWEDESDDERLPAKMERLSTTELKLLSSGRVAMARGAAALEARKARAERRRAASRTLTLGRKKGGNKDATSTSQDEEELNDSDQSRKTVDRRDRQLYHRTEQGMMGVSLQQRQTMMVVEKKARQRQQVHQKAEEWAKGRIANKQKYYRAAGPMRPLG